MISKAKEQGIIITSHYPAISRFQSNMVLKNANLFDKSVINVFVKKEISKSYLKKVCKFLNKYGR